MAKVLRQTSTSKGCTMTEQHVNEASIEVEAMAQNTEAAVIPPTVERSTSRAAERMRLHRERRRNKLRCLTIELREREIDALIKMGLLKPETRNVTYDVQMALYAFLEKTVGAKQ